MIVEAPAKLNLGLYVGPVREDGLHEIASIFMPLTLADSLVVTAGVERDEVLCPDVEGPELADTALTALRDAGWSSPPVRIEIEKRIPVAAGLGGGSADAAAVLRLARDELDEEALRGLAAELGADVSSQLDPRPALVRGAGEDVRALVEPRAFGVVLVPVRPGLAAADVYAEADRLGPRRDAGDLNQVAERMLGAAEAGASPLDYADLLVNDLQPAALSLNPAIAPALAALEQAGAARALVTGSGPTAFGIFDKPEDAERAAAELGPEHEVLAVAPRIIGS